MGEFAIRLITFPKKEEFARLLHHRPARDNKVVRVVHFLFMTQVTTPAWQVRSMQKFIRNVMISDLVESGQKVACIGNMKYDVSHWYALKPLLLAHN